MSKLAVIDLGSNSIRMTITDIKNNGTYHVLYRNQAMVRLSENMGPDKILQEKPMERTIEMIQTFVKEIGDYDHTEVLLVATAAVRQAANKDAFIAAVKEKTGVDVRLLAGTEEAYYDYLAIKNTLSIDDALIIDTGGGSVELIYMQGKQLLQSISLPIGAVNLSESYLPKDRIRSEQLFDALVGVQGQLANVDWLNQIKNLPIVALGGSNRTFAKISRRQNDLMDVPVHGYQLNESEVFAIFSQVLSKNLQERKDMAGLAAARGDIIVGGMLPLIAVIQKTMAKQVIFSQAGLREGLLFEYMLQQNDHKIITPAPSELTQISDD